MLIKQHLLKGIAEGQITLVFRRWKRPTVKSGGSLRTPVGLLAVDKVERVNDRSITARQAKSAGYDSRDDLIEELNARADGDVYRIAVRFAGADRRNELRQQAELTEEDLNQVMARMDSIDRRSRHGPWTRRVLELIEKSPGVRASDLAESVGMATKPFKANVRKLKELGLTESLKVGYRLSLRGRFVLQRLKSERFQTPGAQRHARTTLLVDAEIDASVSSSC